METLGADVVGVLVLLEAVALPAGELAAPPVALADVVPVMGGVSTEAAELVCANTCAANAKRKVTNRRRIESDMLTYLRQRNEGGENGTVDYIGRDEQQAYS